MWGVLGILIVLGAVALLVATRIGPRRAERVAHLVQRHRGSPELAAKLAAQPRDELGVVAHELAACLQLVERENRSVEHLNRDVALAQRRLGAVLDVLPSAVMILDDQGRILQFSRPAGRLLGWKPADAHRKPIGHLFPEPFGAGDGGSEAVFQKVRARLADPARNGAAVSFRALGQSAAGVEAPFQVHVQELAGSNKQEYVCLVRPREEESAVVEREPQPAVPAPPPAPVMPAATVDGIELERVDVCAALDAAVAEIASRMPEARKRLRVMGPAHAYANAQRTSLEVALRDVLDASFAATSPTAAVNVMITETTEAVGVVVEAPSAADNLDAPAPPRLTFATEVLRALGGALDIYDDMPGLTQIVIELRRGGS